MTPFPISPPQIITDATLRAVHQRLGVPGNYAQSRGLKLQPEPDLITLVSVATLSTRAVTLVMGAAAAWRQMQAAAEREHVVLEPLSGFRSVARQIEIIEAKLARGLTIDAILAVNTAPGYSEHHTGRAIDIGTPGSPPLEEAFADSPAFAWLAASAAKFRFTLSYRRNNPHGVIYEPWHWCWQK